MAIRVAAQKRVTPQLRLRSRRCTSAHTKAPDGPGSQRPGHNAPVLAVHVDVRPPPGVSIDTPLLLHPIASMQVCAAGVDRSYPAFIPLLSARKPSLPSPC